MRAFPSVHWPHPLPTVLARGEGVLPPVPVYISASLRPCAFALEFRGEVGDPYLLPSCFRPEVSREVCCGCLLPGNGASLNTDLTAVID